MNFIFVSLQQIDTDRTSTSIGLAKALAKNHKVLYVNYPLDRSKLYFGDKSKFDKDHFDRIRENKDTLIQLDVNLWVLWPKTILESINWLPSTVVFQGLNWLNNKRFASEIKQTISDLNFDSYIIINDKDIFRSYFLKELLKPDKYIYLDRDYTIGTKYWRKHGAQLEPMLMQKSDLVVCNSRAFTNRAKIYNKNSFYIGNGFDAMHYNSDISMPEPDDLKNIPRPRIGYIGALITLRLDLDLLVKITEEKPEWSFVFIGPEDDDFKNSKLHKLTNTYFLGKKHTDNIPAYLQHLDVCINPQLINEITDNNFPLKILEYLAYGKPVVATSTNTMKEEFSEYTYLASDKNTYIQKIQQAIQENNPMIQRRRQNFVARFTWESVIEKLLESIDSVSLSTVKEE